jgi:hypothetical protein
MKWCLSALKGYYYAYFIAEAAAMGKAVKVRFSTEKKRSLIFLVSTTTQNFFLSSLNSNGNS